LSPFIAHQFEVAVFNIMIDCLPLLHTSLKLQYLVLWLIVSL